MRVLELLARAEGTRQWVTWPYGDEFDRWVMLEHAQSSLLGSALLTVSTEGESSQ